MKRITLLFLLAVSMAFGQFTLPNAVPLPNARTQVLDHLGRACSGCLLWTYAAGTSTPQVTYTDSSGSTPNTNPIVLDTAGAAAIWIGPLSYKLTLERPPVISGHGVPLWTVDNVSDVTFNYISYLKTISDSALISFIAPGSGAVARTVRDKLAEAQSVKDYGAVGNDSTNDATAIQNAVNGADSILITGGSYVVNSCINVPAGKLIRITGATVRTTSADCVFSISGDNSSITGDRSGVVKLTTLNGNAIRVLPGSDNTTISGITVYGPAHWYDEAHLKLGNTIYAGCSVQEGDCGGLTQVRTRGIHVLNAMVYSGAQGVLLSNVDGGSVSDNSFDVSDRTGSSPVCVGTFCDQKGLAMVLLNGSAGVTVGHNSFQDVADVRLPNAIYSRPSEVSGFTPAYTYGSNSITANTVLSNHTYETINVAEPKTATVGNTIRQAYGSSGIMAFMGDVSSADYQVITGNNISITNPLNGGPIGIILNNSSAGTAHGALVSDNVISVSNRGIWAFGNWEDIQVVGNLVSINSSTADHDAIVIVGNNKRPLISNNKSYGGYRGIGIIGDGVAGAGPTRPVIATNWVYNSAGNCIDVQSNGVTMSTGGNVTGNTLDACGAYGLALSSTVTNFQIASNAITNAVTSQYSYLSTQILSNFFNRVKTTKIGLGTLDNTLYTDHEPMLDMRDDNSVVATRLKANRYQFDEKYIASSNAGSDTSYVLASYHSGGTTASPSILQLGNEMGRFQSFAWSGSAYTSAGELGFWVNTAPSSGFTPTEMQIFLQDAGGVRRQVMRVLPTGTLMIGANAPVGIFSGAGSPEGLVTAAVGSLYLRLDSATSLYSKATGAGSTGWVAK